MRTHALVIATLLLSIAPGCGAGTRPVELSSPGQPLRLARVVMYQNGLAHFERRGRADSSTVDLRVPVAQVDDVLRSLTIVDGNRAAITGVRLLESAEGEDVTLRVGLASEGARDLRISYVTELPGFRPTYRLVAQDDGVHVQGLAVVDNPTSEAWTDVALTLSTEVPLSFRFDLREARAAVRPRFGSDGRLVREAVLNVVNNAFDPGAPMEVNIAYGLAQAGQPEMSTRAGRMVGARNVAEPAAQQVAGAAADPAQAASAQGASAQAQNALLAFEERPESEQGVFAEVRGFDLGRAESGLVPFVDARTEGRLALVYKPSPGGALSAAHPYRAVLFRNPTDASLLTGPVSIFAGSRFVGDGVTGTIPARSHAFVPFALERSVNVQTSTEAAEDEVRATSLAGGVLTVELRALSRTRFVVSATRRPDLPIYLFSPAVAGFEPVQLPEGAIQTTQGVFLPAELDEVGGATMVFDRANRRTTSVNVAADPRHPYVAALLRFLGEGEDVARLRAISDRHVEIQGELDVVAEDMRVERAGLAERRDALASLEGVGGSGPLRTTLSRGVTESVGRVDALTRRASALHAEQIALQQEWYGRLRALTYG